MRWFFIINLVLLLGCVSIDGNRIITVDMDDYSGRCLTQQPYECRISVESLDQVVVDLGKDFLLNYLYIEGPSGEGFDLYMYDYFLDEMAVDADSLALFYFYQDMVESGRIVFDIDEVRSILFEEEGLRWFRFSSDRVVFQEKGIYRLVFVEHTESELGGSEPWVFEIGFE